MAGPSQNTVPSLSSARRFAVEPVETSSKSKRKLGSKPEAAEAEQSHTGRKFVPQLLEQTTIKSTRRRGGRHVQPEEATDQEQPPEAEASLTVSARPKRFTPQLVETARRSRKSGDQGSALQQSDKTDVSPGDKIHLPRHMRLVRPTMPAKVSENIPFQSKGLSPQVPQSHFSYASLSKKKPRQSSFRVPQLEPIVSPGDSDDSNGSNIPSLSTTPSAISEENEVQKQARRINESVDEEFSGYVLSLAARAAEKQLREQALAAFPNERFHQPVDHFAGNRDSTGSDEEVSSLFSGGFDDPDIVHRRMSSAGWDIIEMQKHKEKVEEQRRQQHPVDAKTKMPNEDVGPWRNPFDFKTLQDSLDSQGPKNPIGGALRDFNELAKWRNAASPPMLGKDLQFPLSVSPKQTRIDPTQKPCSRLQKLGTGTKSRKQSGLWTPFCNSPSLTRKNTRLPDSGAASPGLWGGFCDGAQNSDFLCISNMQLQAGLHTPRAERETPIASHQLPTLPTSPDYTSDLSNIDSVLNFEATIDVEYPDEFITQVYNYLSLGYPALARKFDAELSKISSIPVEEIRRGDERANTKGHVGAPEGDGWDQRRCKEECGRWTALKLYIHEWARQRPHMVDGAESAWVTRARKGSWAI